MEPMLESDESKVEQANILKEEGNQLLQRAKFAAAIEKYTLAISFCSTAVYFANRALAHIKMESYGLALEDANYAITRDPRYVKGYYRRASANLALGKHKLALRDLKFVVSLAPSDQDAAKKYRICEKIVMEEAFAEAIQSENTLRPSETINVESIAVESGYNGPSFDEEMTQEFITHMIRWFVDSRRPIHKKYCIKILLKLLRLLDLYPNLVEVNHTAENQKMIVCGDTHGQFYDLLNIFELAGQPSTDIVYVFNGDFVDRGSWSTEVILTLMCYKLLLPHNFHLIRGNHEAKSMNRVYGFEGEVKSKYDATGKTAELFNEVFNMLPLGGLLLNRAVMVVHGGLPCQDGVTLHDINAIDRKHEPPESGLFSDILWNDPHPGLGRIASKRGVGCQFGSDVTSTFLRSNGLELLIRSHEVRDEGYSVEHNGKCITIFSAPNYCDQQNNKGAFITFMTGSHVPQYTQFNAVPHPDVKPMAYASNSQMMGL